jgi:acylphosphatase
MGAIRKQTAARKQAVIRRRAIVSGEVQGVGFRANARAEARRLGVGGFARNLSDGTVEVEVEGADAAVATMLRWLRRGPRWASVDTVTVTEVERRGSTDFDIH